MHSFKWSTRRFRIEIRVPLKAITNFETGRSSGISKVASGSRLPVANIMFHLV